MIISGVMDTVIFPVLAGITTSIIILSFENTAACRLYCSERHDDSNKTSNLENQSTQNPKPSLHEQQQQIMLAKADAETSTLCLSQCGLVLAR